MALRVLTLKTSFLICVAMRLRQRLLRTFGVVALQSIEIAGRRFQGCMPQVNALVVCMEPIDCPETPWQKSLQWEILLDR